MAWKKEKLNIPIGYQSGLLEVIEQLPDKDKRSNFLCRCTCGNKKEVLGKHLTNFNTKSCGCLVPMMCRTHSLSDEKDIVGMKVGRLTIIQRNFDKFGIDSHSSYWLCKCDCGNEKIISKKYLRNGVKSCGCLRNEHLKRPAA